MGLRVEVDEADAFALLQSLGYEAWPDVLIADVALPDEDGYSLMRRVRALEQQNQASLAARMPAIALGAEDTTRAVMSGFQTQLSKPVRDEELIFAVAHLARPAHNHSPNLQED